MSEEDLITSSFNRMVKLGGLVGRVGASVLTEKALALFRTELSQEVHKIKNLTKNAQRVVETLGKLKGAAMKAGQMLSLYEGLLPPEVTQILASLQKEAPCVPFEVMEAEIKNELKDRFALFKHIDPTPYAAASIGQVHRGELRDGRKVAVKIQYPAIDDIIKADLKNLKTFLAALFSLFTNIDVEPVWEELQDRLLEELSYTREAANLRRMAALHAQIPEIVIPVVCDEVSGERVLTMELVEGIPAREACRGIYPQDLRNKWGRTLLEYALRGIYEFRYLHADPNFSNFAFLPDGRVIAYDFGCMKEVPEVLARGYSRIVLAVLEGDRDKISSILKDMGVTRNDGTPVSQEVVHSYIEFFQIVLRESPPYTFGEDGSFYTNFFKLTRAHWNETSGIKFPKDVVFIDRTMSGHFGNLCKFKACAPWREIIGGYAKRQLL